MPVLERAVGCTGAACLPALGGAALIAGPEPAAAAPAGPVGLGHFGTEKKNVKKNV